MPNRIHHRMTAVVVAGVLSLAACSSSGGGPAPSQQRIVDALKADATVKKELGPLVHNDPTVLDTLYACIAKAMRKDADPADVNAYVNGKKTLDAVAQTKSAATLQNDLTACATNTVPVAPVSPSGAPSS